MKYELTVLAALVQLSEPTISSIAEATKISRKKIEKVISDLKDELGVKISKLDSSNSKELVVKSWGCFETGSELKKTLLTRDLLAVYKDRNSTKIIKAKVVTTSRKRDYFNSVKLKNYRHSLRLEGHEVSITQLPSDKKSRQKLREQLLESYSKKGSERKAHG